MITKELLNPESIVIIGASNDIAKPGGRILKNIIEGGYGGKLYAVNPKENEVQGIECLKSPEDLPGVDLAILAIAAKYIPQAVKTLAEEKGAKGFIILSAGFSETSEEGKKLEDEIVGIIDKAGGSLIGPNCIGMITPKYMGSFAGPMPKLDPKGVDFVSGSGATAVFILESAIPMGLKFASLYSVGNSAQIGVEEVLEYWDEAYQPGISPRIKMIYIEKVDKPKKLLKHSRSLIRKGCKIVAIKAGTTSAGSRAVSSHTGALAGSDGPVAALFEKAGIIRCFGRGQLIYAASVLMHKELAGKNIAVITHAGGPGVMITDALQKGGLDAPHIKGEKADELLGKLFHGSAVGNPIDFLATGTAEQLGIILDYVDNHFDNIDASVVIFGTPGLFDVAPVYKTLHEKMNICKKPIFPVLPSVILAKDAIEEFLSYGRIYFPEEVNLGEALARVYNTPAPAGDAEEIDIDTVKIREIIDKSENGYIPPKSVQDIFDAAGIRRVNESIVRSVATAVSTAKATGFPVVMKVVGPVHKTEAGGVALNVINEGGVKENFERLMSIDGAEAVLIQPMISGMELFAGAKKEGPFGHLILCGLGGIFVEILKDVSTGLAPLNREEALGMIRKLKSYKMIQGARGRQGADENKYAEALLRLSALTQAAPEIAEMDINPFIASSGNIIAVDARIRLEK